MHRFFNFVVSVNTFFSKRFCFVLFVFLRPHPQHIDVPRLRVKSELWLLACTTVTAMLDPSYILDLHYSSQQRWILKPLVEARD